MRYEHHQAACHPDALEIRGERVRVGREIRRRGRRRIEMGPKVSSYHLGRHASGHKGLVLHLHKGAEMNVEITSLQKQTVPVTFYEAVVSCRSSSLHYRGRPVMFARFAELGWFVIDMELHNE